MLCALLNSFVANYLIRLRVNTHVTASLLARLPVPLVTSGEPAFERFARLSAALTRGGAPVEAMPEYSELQARVAVAYGLEVEEFEHVLTTFPLVSETTREAALRCFRSIAIGGDPA